MMGVGPQQTGPRGQIRLSHFKRSRMKIQPDQLRAVETRAQGS